MSKIIVIGSSNTDMVVKTHKFPVPGETILGGDFFMFSGGKGANQAVAAARMGSEVTLICKIGNDIFGQRALDEYEKEGISTKYITRDLNKASGTALILVDKNGENEIVVAPGANDTLNEKNIADAQEVIAAADVVLLQLEIPLLSVLHAAKKGFESGTKVILNPAPARELPDELFKYLYLITPNETEAEMLTGIKVLDTITASKAASVLLESGVQNVIITMGSQGAFFKNDTTEIVVKAPVVNAVDTTAAGDVFNGVLAVGITFNQGWKEAINNACKAASISVTRMGAQASMPYKKEVDELGNS